MLVHPFSKARPNFELIFGLSFRAKEMACKSPNKPGVGDPEAHTAAPALSIKDVTVTSDYEILDMQEDFALVS